MFVLEIRKMNAGTDFPALYHYNNLTKDELIARMSCGYFIKGNKQYRVESNATESDLLSVIYVEEEPHRAYQGERIYSKVGFEVRDLGEPDTPLLMTREFATHLDVLQYLHSDLIYIRSGQYNKEMLLDSLEIDEDRHCYVYYGTFTGVMTQGTSM